MSDPLADLWRQVGCGSTAGRELRRLAQLTQKDAAKRVNYPSETGTCYTGLPAQPSRKRVSSVRERQKNVDLLTPLQVDAGRIEMDTRGGVPLARPVRPAIRTQRACEAEVAEADRQRRHFRPAHEEKNVDKRHLQERFAFGGGMALPPAAMGFAVRPNMQLPNVDPREAERVAAADARDVVSEEQREAKLAPAKVRYAEQMSAGTAVSRTSKLFTGAPEIAKEIQRQVAEDRRRREEVDPECDLVEELEREVSAKKRDLTVAAGLAEELRGSTKPTDRAGMSRLVAMDKKVLELANGIERDEGDLRQARRIAFGK